MNLNEASGEQLQQTLQSMPKGKALMKELVRLTEASRCSQNLQDQLAAGLPAVISQDGWVNVAA